MMDSKLKPWLLEINTNPSLSSSSPLDKMMKTSLVCDMYNIIGLKVKPALKSLREAQFDRTSTIKKKKSVINERKSKIKDLIIDKRNKSI